MRRALLVHAVDSILPMLRSVLRRSHLRGLVAPYVAAVLRELGSANLQQDLREIIGADARMILDVGAWEGQDSAAYARLFRRAAIHAFEPNPATLQILQARPIERTTVHAVALGSADERRELMLRGGLSSLLPLTADGLAHYGRKDVEHRSVTVRRLDDVVREIGIDSVDLLKIDVQGYELEVLAGASTTLQQTRVVQVECNFVPHYEQSSTFSDIDLYLRQYGFRLHNLYDLFRDQKTGRLIFGDGLFVRT